MTPTPQENLPTHQDHSDGNRVVISGMSGLYPQSHNIQEFSEMLYNKINPVTENDLHFKYNHPEVVQYSGSVSDLQYFDAQFFKVHFRLAFTMDPMAKKVLEQSYQAIYDAGINPDQLSGKKVGVYIGSCFSEMEKVGFYEFTSRSGFGIAGCSKTMFANRISYWLNAKGPSMAIDQACCSSTAALEQAYLAITRGECEAAIVGGSYLCLHPQSSVHYGRIIKLCSDGKTKSFDAQADGCAKSEAINILFLQKAKHALRIYAEVLNVKTEYTCTLQEETGPKYGFYRNISSVTNFIKKFYEDTKVPPQAIEYVEAFGSASPDADEIELKAIEEVFCKERDDPLCIGSVMSNIGYSEAASGIAAITKVLLGYHNGKLAANLHCNQPRQDIAALREGRMRVVTEHQEFGRTFVGINGMSVTGVNSHVLLNGHYKPKIPNRYNSNMPRLVTISGRHEEAVKDALDILKSNPIDPEQLALLHNIHRTSVSGHLGRGYIVLDTNEQQQTVCLTERAEYFDDARRPLWFVYSGMGSQWSAMGAQLMRIPIFAAAIERCRKALEPKGLDIIAIITSPEEKFKNILQSFVGIAAIQIGLTDILRELGLKPDGIIGHSVGELGCAYADGCLTAEEMILSAYYRGLVSLETKFIHGSMAAVGLGYVQISKMCPPEIEVACHNGPESSTISGPSDVMRAFVAELTSKQIFAKEVPCSNIAYHSRYIANAGPALMKYLSETIISPKARSERWLSSSVPEDRWDEPIAKSCSAEYLTNNLLSPVLFEETSRLIPKDAVLVEIAPHGLLQAILKRSMPPSCVNIPLTRRNHTDNVFLLLEAIGKLYMQGYNSDVQVLYPKVEMPVSTGTPFLSHFVKWAHAEKWPMPLYSSANRIPSSNANFVIALQDKEHAYIKGHSIRGNTLYPFAASLTLVWDTFGMVMGSARKQLSVEFTDVHLYAQPVLHNRRQLKLSVTIQRGTGRFEVLDGDSKVATGYIKPLEVDLSGYTSPTKKSNAVYFTSQDVYQLLRDRHYLYSGEFQSINNVNEAMTDAELFWRGNWVTFMDGMLQLNALRQPHNGVSLPTRIRRIRIDVNEHMHIVGNSDAISDIALIPAQVNEVLDRTRCGGISIENILFKTLPLIDETKFGLKTLTWISNIQSNQDVASSLEVYFQIVAENVNKDIITVVGLPNQITEGSVFNKIHEAIRNVYGVKINYKELNTDTSALRSDELKTADLVLVQNLSTDDNLLYTLQQSLHYDQFVVTDEDRMCVKHSELTSVYRELYAHSFVRSDNGDQSELRLVRWGPKSTTTATTAITVKNENDFKFLSSVHANLASDHRLLIITSYPSPPGLKELIRYWRQKHDQNKLHMIAVSDDSFHNLDEKLREIELLAYNVLNHDTWGGEFYLPVNGNAVVNKKHAILQSAQIGDLNSLSWVDAPALAGPGVTVTVHYVGINTNDIRRANGTYHSMQSMENSYGSDFSGITENGQRVMGIVSSGAASTQVRARPDLLWPVPEHWSLEDAASVPLAYAHALYCLGIKTKLYSGMSIMVHGGAGALGQAVISIALAHNCEVFTTVSDLRKKRFLQRLFPALKADHIGNSRDETFSEMVLTATKQYGCDIVISCTRENLKDKSMKCTSHFGTCFDISQIQNQDNYVFGMFNLHVLKNYCTVDFSLIFATSNIVITKNIHQMISEGISRGYVRPLSRLIYDSNEAARGFRLLAKSQHRGRVLLRISDNILQGQQRLTCSPDSTHFVFCEEIALGLQLADRLVARGVSKLCLHVPTQSAYVQHKIRNWRVSGIQVSAISEKVTEQNLYIMITQALDMGLLEGVYVITGSDKDYTAEETFVKYLDVLLRKLCPQLRYFAVLNNNSQSIGKNVCLQRVRDELPGTMLTLPVLDHEYNLSNGLNAIDAIEKALQSAESVILAHPVERPRPSLLQTLLKIAGIEVEGNVDKKLSLQELGVESHKLQSIMTFLEVKYNYALDEQQVSSLTINTILKLENTLIESPYTDIKGLQILFSYVDSDELLATTEMVLMPTLVNSASMRDDEFDFDRKHLCIIPGMEGHHERFRVLCERLKLPAFVLQPGLDHPHETLTETAARFIEILLKKTDLKDTFYLLGYETGILTALEMARILEDRGCRGTVFCIGNAPEELKQELKIQLADYETEEQLENAVLRHMYTLMTGDDASGLDDVLRETDTWSQKINPVTQKDLRFKYNHPEVVQYSGSVPDLQYFDAQFFKVHFRLALTMDPMAKKVLEQSYQAIYDAGINPDQLSGKKVGVYIGSCFSETEKACFYESAHRSGFAIAGWSKTMFANRISYWLNAKGPSMAIDEACCSSTAALEQAYLAITRGECEAAIVGGSYLCLHPQSSVHYGRTIKLCSDGKTKSFDAHADGCARSEAINILFLQKAKHAFRIYAEVLNVKSEYTCMMHEEIGPKYGFYRNINSVTNFLKKFYEDTKVPPQAIEYVEAFGSASPDADEIELKAIEEVFCKERDDPLFIGTVMSNIGYSEAASGIAAITKVLLGYHNGKLAANLHCNQPRQDIAALREGRMRVVTEHQEFGRTFVGINGMSVTGVNSHVLLNGHYIPKIPNRYKSNIPRLVTISGRHAEAVKDALDILKSNPIDPEQLALLHNIHRTSVSGHLGRGYIVLDTNEQQQTVCLTERAQYFDDARRPLWFVYSGMGSQWSAMGEQLMRIPIFAAAIERCGKALEPKGLDIIAIITSPEENFKNILHSFVGIAAIQIGLTDILRELGLKPDGIIGHSVGELGCAYADGCLTAEEMILSAYYRGLVSLETKFIHGSMAAIGLGYEQISEICPPEIEIACHNGPESSTISGPSDIMRAFVAELTFKQIFAKEVPCSNIAYHSRYIANAGPALMKYLSKIIISPKPRSERWLSSSVPEDRWDEPIAKSCSAEYLTNNLLSPVLFEETSRLIPKDAVLVEIAPHGLLQAILKRSLPSSCINIPLTKRNHTDNVFFLFEAIGKLYIQGYNSDVRVLYPKVEMPVSTGTPFLSHFVKWAHAEKWPMPLYSSANRIPSSNANFVIALQDKEHAYIKGHSIRGNTLYPFAASLTLVWDTFDMVKCSARKQLSVEFTDVHLYAQPVLHNRRQLKLSVTIHRGTGRFEVLDGDSKVATGYIKPLEVDVPGYTSPNKKSDTVYFTSQDVYQLLRDRHYLYSGEFQSIHSVNEAMTDAELLWRGNWVTFIDGMLQLNALRQLHNGVSLPTRIRRIRIDVNEHMRIVSNSDAISDITLIPAQVNEVLHSTRCGGILIENIQFKTLPLIDETKLALKTLTWISNIQSNLDVSISLEVYFQIVAENVNKNIITVVGLPNQIKEGSVFNKIHEAIRNVYGVKINYKELNTDKRALRSDELNTADLVLVQNLSTDDNLLNTLQQSLHYDQFVVTDEDRMCVKQSESTSVCRELYAHSYVRSDNGDQSELRLVRWGPKSTTTATTAITVKNEDDFKFLSSVYANLASDHRLLIITSYPSPPGLKELIRYWRQKHDQNKLYMIAVSDGSFHKLDEKLRDIELLAYNVLNHDTWGGEFYLSVNGNVDVNKKHAILQSAQIGDLDSLSWVDAPALAGPGVTVTVHYVGINTNDIRRANGTYHSMQSMENSYGSDFSGITENGQRVMGIVSSGAARTQVRARPDLLWPVPEHWSLEDAATVPLAYAQAFYCLGIKTKLYSGMSILVHGGAGALGQAVISVALAHNCEVFTTVSDLRKKRFLQRLFPALKADHIGNSRDETFCEMVLTATKQHGCNIIISCTRENLKDKSLKCTSYLGTCLDVSQIQNQDNYAFGMHNLFVLKNYCTVDFSSIFTAQNIGEIKNLHQIISEGISRGYVRPLSRLTYDSNEAARGFRLLAKSQHRGRVLLRMSDNILQGQQRLTCNPDSTHFVFCDETALGLQLADRLVARGVRKLCLHVPTQSAYLEHKIRTWRVSGIQVSAISAKVIEQNLCNMITQALNMGLLEGVYVITGSDKDHTAEESFVRHLNVHLRKLCPQLRYFAVLNNNSQSIGKNVCLQRVHDELPGTMLMLPVLDHESNLSNGLSAIDAIEKALQSTESVILAHTVEGPRPSLLQALLKIADIDVIENVDNRLTLQELGVESQKLHSIMTFLEVKYNYILDEQQVSSLTINTILTLEKTLIESPYADIKGLETFFTYVDSDELLATTDLVFMPTLVNSASMRDDEFDFAQKNLCIIPGMEGHHERFRVLCERLKVQAFVLQPGLDHPHEILTETAARFIKILQKKTDLKNTFSLLGYETGILIALEMARILEDHGCRGTVFCIGNALEELKQELKIQLADYETEEQLENAVLRHMYTLMTGDDASGLDDVLRETDPWSQKVSACVRVLLGRVSHSAQYARALIECALARVQRARRGADVTPQPLHSRVVLLRAAHDPPQYAALQQYSRQPLVVHQLNTRLAHVAADLSCAAIINEHLDPAILEAFSARNICDTYLINGNVFMSIENSV